MPAQNLQLPGELRLRRTQRVALPRWTRLLALTALVGANGLAHAFDFKGLVLGEQITGVQVEEKLNVGCVSFDRSKPCDESDIKLYEKMRVQCGEGHQGATVCNGWTTIAGIRSPVNVVIGGNGLLQLVRFFSLSPDDFEVITDELRGKFGRPKSQRNSTVQNAFAAQYAQTEVVWTDSRGRRIDFSRYGASLDSSFLQFSTAKGREPPTRQKGDL